MKKLVFSALILGATVMGSALFIPPGDCVTEIKYVKSVDDEEWYSVKCGNRMIELYDRKVIFVKRKGEWLAVISNMTESRHKSKEEAARAVCKCD